MRCAPALLALTFLTAVSVSSAEARTRYNNHLPNGDEFECEACHTEAPLQNDFGWDVGFTLPLGEVDWSLVWHLDSDGDGQSNGFELGDACGEWARNGGDPGRLEDLANPGDPLSVVPDTVPVPDCPAPGDDDDSATADDDDSAEPEPESCGYSVAAAAPSTPLALLILAIVAWRRRC